MQTTKGDVSAEYPIKNRGIHDQKRYQKPPSVIGILRYPLLDNHRFLRERLRQNLNVSVDYLVRDEITDPHYGLSSPAAPVSDLTADETQLIDDYRSLNEQGQAYIRQTMYMAKQTHKKMPDLSDLEKQA